MRHGQLPIFEGNQVGATQLSFSGKATGPGDAVVELYEEAVIVMKVKCEDIAHKWNDTVGTIRDHKMKVGRVVIVPPAEADAFFDKANESMRENIEASMGVASMLRDGKGTVTLGGAED